MIIFLFFTALVVSMILSHFFTRIFTSSVLVIWAMISTIILARRLKRRTSDPQSSRHRFRFVFYIFFALLVILLAREIRIVWVPFFS